MMSLFRAMSLDSRLGLWRSSSEVDLSVVDRRRKDDGGSLTPAAPRASIPSWYRGLHQSIRALSHSGLNLNQLDEDDDEEEDVETLGIYRPTASSLLPTLLVTRNALTRGCTDQFVTYLQFRIKVCFSTAEKELFFPI